MMFAESISLTNELQEIEHQCQVLEIDSIESVNDFLFEL